MQNFGRQPVIDPVRSWAIDEDCYGSDADAEANGARGHYVVMHDPANPDPYWQIMDGPYADANEAERAMREMMGE